jgi:hypothetical protein
MVASFTSVAPTGRLTAAALCTLNALHDAAQLVLHGKLLCDVLPSCDYIRTAFCGGETTIEIDDCADNVTVSQGTVRNLAGQYRACRASPCTTLVPLRMCAKKAWRKIDQKSCTMLFLCNKHLLVRKTRGMRFASRYERLSAALPRCERFDSHRSKGA